MEIVTFLWGFIVGILVAIFISTRQFLKSAESAESDGHGFEDAMRTLRKVHAASDAVFKQQKYDTDAKLDAVMNEAKKALDAWKPKETTQCLSARPG